MYVDSKAINYRPIKGTTLPELDINTGYFVRRSVINEIPNGNKR